MCDLGQTGTKFRVEEWMIDWNTFNEFQTYGVKGVDIFTPSAEDRVSQ